MRTMKIVSGILLLLSDGQVLSLQNGLCANIKSTKTQIYKPVQSDWFLLNLLDLPQMKNVITPLAKIFLISLGLTETESAADAGIYKKLLGLGRKH